MVIELIGQLLLLSTSLTEAQLSEALDVCKRQKSNQKLGQILIERNYITPGELANALAKQWGFEYLPIINHAQINGKLVENIELDFLKKHLMVPIYHNKEIAIVINDPLNLCGYDQLTSILNVYCPRIISTPEEIAKAITKCYFEEDNDAAGSSDTQSNDNAITDHGDQAKDINEYAEDILNISDKAPVKKLINNILFDAVHKHASDIHIEPYQNEIKVRFRIDGELRNYPTLPINVMDALVLCLKTMAKLDIIERRLPQDGQSLIKIDEKFIDLRCSVIPTKYGERIVLRLLDKTQVKLNLTDIGFDNTIRKNYEEILFKKNGLILITGPTGSGKTSTLYASLTSLNDSKRNILTVEDPIEYQISGIGQMQVRPKIDLTFSKSLKHILRQDPDVIMIGEIRDEETAQIAIQSSLTGHMVLSTLHTNDAASAYTRLIDMDIKPYLIASSVSAIMAQRLIKKICPHCKTQNLTVHPLYKHLDTEHYYGTGCDHCAETGYSHRTGIFELLIPNDTINALVTQKSSSQLIKTEAIKSCNMNTLRKSGIQLAIEGITTLNEVLSTTNDDHYQQNLMEVGNGKI